MLNPQPTRKHPDMTEEQWQAHLAERRAANLDVEAALTRLLGGKRWAVTKVVEVNGEQHEQSFVIRDGVRWNGNRDDILHGPIQPRWLGQSAGTTP